MTFGPSFAARGGVASAATLSAVIETLQTLPGAAPPGRLSRALKPSGLEALAGLVRSASSFPRPLERRDVANVESSRPSTRREREHAAKTARTDAREAARRKREVAKLDDEIRQTRAVERKALADRDRAREALARAERERDHLAEKLQFLEKQISQAAADVRRAEERLTGAAGDRAALERRRDTT